MEIDRLVQLSANDLAEPDRRANTRVSTLCSSVNIGDSKEVVIADQVVHSCFDEMGQAHFGVNKYHMCSIGRAGE